jgi:saccharopine dehydrogenase-like NADP-dependent oxidoreductase
MAGTVAVVGASGRVGAAVDTMLTQSGFRTIRIDRAGDGVVQADARDPGSLARAMEGAWLAVSAVPFDLCRYVAAAAIGSGIGYLDLTEDVATTDRVRSLAETASSVVIPQCGLAPGFVSIAARAASEHFEEIWLLEMRVGALPRVPSGELGYALTWSTEGLVNEYIRPCPAIRDRRIVELEPLTETGSVVIDGIRYESFLTSGGAGMLDRWAADGRIRNLDYKTLRYPGHARFMRFLVHDLGFRGRPEDLVALLERSLPRTHDDIVAVSVAAHGIKDGRPMKVALQGTITGFSGNGMSLTAIEFSTAASAAGVVELAASGHLPQRGLVAQDSIPLGRFLETRWGKAAYGSLSWREGVPGHYDENGDAGAYWARATGGDGIIEIADTALR